jgi:hypothetical protein
MKIVNLPVREIKDPNELCDKIIALFQEYECSIAEAIGYMEIIKTELIEDMYE